MKQNQEMENSVIENPTEILTKVDESREAKSDMEESSVAEEASNTETVNAISSSAQVNKKYFVLGLVLIFVAVLLAFVVAFGMANSNNQSLNNGFASLKTTVSENSNDASTVQTSSHVHDWETVLGTVHHDAETHTVEHPAEYQNKTNYHTVCNVCGNIIDNNIQSHQSETGHYSWTTNVPVAEEELFKEAWTETVTDKAAYDETVVSGRKCKTCGAEEKNK